MTVTLNLPPDIELAFRGEAQARGLSLDDFLSLVILAHTGHVDGESQTDTPPFQLMREEGVPVLRTGTPIEVSIVNETVDAICRERELSILGRPN